MAEVESPPGHRRRRKEALPLLLEKAGANMADYLPKETTIALIELCLDRRRLTNMPVDEFMELLAV